MMNKNSLQVSDELPKNWTITTLGEVLPISYGKSLTESKRDAKGQHPVYGSSGKVGQHSQSLTSKATLLIGRKGSVGAVYYSPGPCWPIDTTYFAEEREDIDLRFFEYLLKGLNLRKLDKSTAVPGLSRDDYNAVQVAIAPIQEQSHIVAEIEKEFSRLDEAVAGLKRIKANLKRYKASVLKAAVEGKLTEEWRKTHPNVETGAELLKRILVERKKKWEEKNPGKRYKEPVAPDTDSLPELPKGWVWATVEVICEQIVDCPHSTPRFREEGYPCIDTNWMTTDGLINGKARFVDHAVYQERIARLTPKHGDIVFAREGTIGTAVIIPEHMTPCLGQRVMLLRVSGCFSGKLLLHVLHSEIVRAQYRAQALGSTVTHINVGDVKLFTVPLPPFLEQHCIAAEVDRRLSFIREVEAQVDANLKRAEHLRQGILKKAFSGPLVNFETVLNQRS